MSDRVVKWVLPIEQDDQGELLVTLPDDLLGVMGLKEGDTLAWNLAPDGTLSIDKV